MRSIKNTRAFTLVEMVIVLVLLGILAALAIPTFQTLVENSRVEGTRLAAEAAVGNANALVSLEQGTDASAVIDNATWTAIDGEMDSTIALAGPVGDDGTATLTKSYGSTTYSCAITINADQDVASVGACAKD